MVYSRSGEKNSGFFARVSSLSVVSKIIIVNILIFIFLNISFLFLNSVGQDSILSNFALQPSAILHGQFLWALVLHMFSHVWVWHILFNMIALFSLGGLCERIIGGRKFFWFYMIGGLFAGILSVVLAGLFGYGYWGVRIFGSPDSFMLGASGAIFAIAGLFVVLLPRLRFSIIFLPFITFPAYIIVPVILLLTWAVTITSNLPIGNVAHLGGFIVGLAYGYYLRLKYPKKIKLLQQMFR